MIHFLGSVTATWMLFFDLCTFLCIAVPWLYQLPQ